MDSANLPKEPADLLARLQRLQSLSGKRRSQEKQCSLDLGSSLLPEEVGTSRRYPTLFTRVSLFAPIRRRADKDTDWHKGELIKTAWGAIRRFGPGLDIYDEDTLIALLNVARSRTVTARPHALPIPLQAVGDDDEVTVHVGRTSAYALNRFLGRQVGGRDLEACRASILRLAKTSLHFVHESGGREALIHLFSYEGDCDARGEITVQFDPAIIVLLERSYSYIDLSVRSRLSDLGKAVHRFLSSQPSQYQIQLTKLQVIVRYPGPFKAFKRSLAGQLEKMSHLGWLSTYVIEGSGRKVPFVLSIDRPPCRRLTLSDR